ncbi:hypothetical protein N7476_000292 [Penicillium atrosanguineum]|uniref:Uncharacterized protein n=1 Tax=Penicillium atrosanguineum TaxID=1132637 RepID=A0A9W9QB75_9EURO|nr:hypothetical protein N7476_000292 [Penicillium atrosanguineum]
MAATTGLAMAALFAAHAVANPTSSDEMSKSSTQSAEPNCIYERGIAYMDSTPDNIDHLRDVRDEVCGVEARKCVRVSYQDHSGIFLCNYVGFPTCSRMENMIADQMKNSYSVTTKCGHLEQPALKIQQSCKLGDFYTFGIMGRSFQNTSDRIDYYISVAGAEP